MVRKAPPATDGDVDPIARLGANELVLVVGDESPAGHGALCRSLSARDSVTHPLRVCANTTDSAVCLGDATAYEAGAGNYEGLDLHEAGVLATEASHNLANGTEPPAGLHLCVDGVPVPDDPRDRRTVFEFLHGITRAIGGQGVGCHVHVATAPGSEFARTLAPIFDEVLELTPGPRARRNAWDGDAGAWQSLTRRPRE